jgi:hypothetical protein
MMLAGGGEPSDGPVYWPRSRYLVLNKYFSNSFYPRALLYFYPALTGLGSSIPLRGASCHHVAFAKSENLELSISGCFAYHCTSP